MVSIVARGVKKLNGKHRSELMAVMERLDTIRVTIFEKVLSLEVTPPIDRCRSLVRIRWVQCWINDLLIKRTIES
jgi:hypothetical protein